MYDRNLQILEKNTLTSSPQPTVRVRHLSRLLFLSLILIIFSFSTAQAKTFKVIRVYDGDTITVLNAGQKQSIRLVGIDTPEKSRKKGDPGQPYSRSFCGGLTEFCNTIKYQHMNPHFS